MQEFDGNVIRYGILGSVTDVPAGFTVETVLVAGAGINGAMVQWGDALLHRYGKLRYAYKRDYILTHLGYSTVRHCASDGFVYTFFFFLHVLYPVDVHVFTCMPTQLPPQSDGRITEHTTTTRPSPARTTKTPSWMSSSTPTR